MEIETKVVPVTCVMNSLIGTGRERPVSWGNYFWIGIDGGSARVANMWWENLEHAAKTFTSNDVRVRIYRDDKRVWCLIDDDRIPTDYYYNKLCFTGGPGITREMAADMYSHLGDPENEFEQFTDTKEYHRKRGGECDERGFVTYRVGSTAS
jgi:hypothetical protein